MGQAFSENGYTALPIFEAFPYSWEGEILKILFFSKFYFCEN
jgi:hypothetical protein